MIEITKDQIKKYEQDLFELEFDLHQSFLFISDNLR